MALMHTIQVRQKKWKLEFASRHKLLASCHYGRCDLGSQQMVVRKSLQGTMAVDTVIHEFTHAFFQDLREEVVEEYATELTAVLFALKIIDNDWGPKEC